MGKWGFEEKGTTIHFATIPQNLISLNPQIGTIEDFWRWGWCTGRDHRTG
jgi:hypothetical protein